MILIADSGSTKTDWLVIEGGERNGFQTIGLNPYFLTEEEISQRISEDVAVALDPNKIEHVYFYGAGCGIVEKQQIVQRAIASSVKEACIEVNSDMFGAARSLFQEEKGIACILGTGANSCVYDGNSIVDNVSSLGYILADWGSGAVLGKELMSAILLRKLPTEVLQDFYDRYQLSRVQILERIYRSPMPNRFLASFVPFLNDWKETEECRHILKDSFSKFLDYYVLSYKEAEEGAEVRFVGSIAYHFRELLQETSEEKGVNMGLIQKQPIAGLETFHKGCSENILNGNTLNGKVLTETTTAMNGKVIEVTPQFRSETTFSATKEK
ncbi:N-acetylglucosamine kinase [Algivirga pacifica]|uniref:ATPase n=1 Tax=Algivirga pacifica TaxID=1162670 RepID=A0ABP9D8Q9_9BACT